MATDDKIKVELKFFDKSGLTTPMDMRVTSSRMLASASQCRPRESNSCYPEESATRRQLVPPKRIRQLEMKQFTPLYLDLVERTKKEIVIEIPEGRVQQNGSRLSRNSSCLEQRSSSLPKSSGKTPEKAIHQVSFRNEKTPTDGENKTTANGEAISLNESLDESLESLGSFTTGTCLVRRNPLKAMYKA